VIFVLLAMLGVFLTGGPGGEDEEIEQEVELEILSSTEENGLSLEVRMKNLREEEINLRSNKFIVISQEGFEHRADNSINMENQLHPDDEDTFTLDFFDFQHEDLEPVELTFEADDTAEPIGWAEI